MSYLTSIPQSAALLEVFKRFPEPSRPLIEFHEVVLRGTSPFSEMERELIAGYVSFLNRCKYCRAVHAAAAERLGAPVGLVARLAAEEDLISAPDKLRSVLLLARKLTLEPHSPTKAEADAVFAAGWGEEGLFHAVAITALFNFMNRLVEGLGIELDPNYVQTAADRIADRGYLPLLKMIGDRPRD